MEKKIKITLKNKSFPRIFFLEWLENDNPSTKWITTQHENIIFNSIVNWRKVCKISVCSTSEGTGFLISNLEEANFRNVPLMKSLLQKCIRRQMLEQAVQTALHLIKLNPDAFLRRIFVIMLEDVSLHTSISTIVWLTSAISKGFKLRLNHIEWLLGVVQYLCQNPHKTYMVHNHHNQYDVSSILPLIEQSHLSNIYKDVIYTILFRISYGGMPSDLNIFYWYVQQILCGEIDVSDENINPIEINKIKPLQICDILPNGADFHCYPFLPSLLNKNFPQFTESEIKKCIWECSSKINTRISNNIDLQMMEMWKIIQVEVTKIQIKLIRTRH